MEWGLGSGESKIPFVIDETNINRGREKLGARNYLVLTGGSGGQMSRKHSYFPAFQSCVLSVPWENKVRGQVNCCWPVASCSLTKGRQVLCTNSG